MRVGVLVSGRGQPPMDFTIPWAVIPIPGFLVGFWAADRYAGRFRDRAGWRGKLGIFLDSIRIIREYISGRTSDRQGLARPPQVTVLSTMQLAQQYITAKSVAPGAQE